jgi:hypothetical protein
MCLFLVSPPSLFAPFILSSLIFFHVNNIWCRVQIVIFLIIGIHHSVTACLLDETPCFQYRNLCSSVKFWDHIWHAYKQIYIDYSCEYFNSLPKFVQVRAYRIYPLQQNWHWQMSPRDLANRWTIERHWNLWFLFCFVYSLVQVAYDAVACYQHTDVKLKGAQ